MGKHFWSRHINDEVDHKQPGCISGLVQAFDYHHWHSNTRKMIQHRKYEYEVENDSKCDWSPVTKLFPNDSCEVEMLLDEKESPFLRTKRSRLTNKRSLKSRIKALIGEEMSKEIGDKRHKNRFSLQRTYSIHHLESLDDSIGKICTDWKQPIIFLPGNVENYAHKKESSSEKDEPDVLDLFKVDKALFEKHLKDADEGILKFSGNTKGSNKIVPLPEFTPSRLQHKQNENWSFSKGEKLKENIVSEEISIRKYIHRRSSSLNESLDKYARLFDNSYKEDSKLLPCKSLKLTNEKGNTRMNFRRVRSLSNDDSYYPDMDFGVAGGDSRNMIVDSNETVDRCNRTTQRTEDCEISNLDIESSEKVEVFQEEGCDVLHETVSQTGGHVKISQDLEKGYNDFNEFNSSIEINDQKNLHISQKVDEKYLKYNNPDLYYVRNILDHSGIAHDSFDRPWHASNQPLGPEIFEEFESFWPHDRDQLIERSEFSSCWHHQMLFDLVNEVLVEIYDNSMSYYPKALSNGCRVKPFPVGNYIVEETSKSIGKMMNLEEKRSLDGIVCYDLANDDKWMNLQFESECVGLELEDMIFDELLEEVICF